MAAESHHPDPRVRTVWRAAALGSTVPSVVVAAGAAIVVTGADLVPGAVSWAAVALVVLAGVAFVVLWPAARYRHWTYAVGEDAVELNHGVTFRTLSVVPYFRVQHVDTSQGPIERRLGLVNLTIHTASAATDATLPGLAAAEADRVRRTVLERAGAGDAV